MAISQKPTEIIGIVHPRGAGGGRVGQEKFWTMRFSVQPWRTKDGPIEKMELSVCKPNLTDAKLDASMKPIEPNTIVRLRVRLENNKDGLGRRQATLLKLVGKTEADTELNALLAEMQKPVTLDHPILGTFTLNREVDWFEATVKWNSKKAKLYLARRQSTKDQKLLEVAELVWKKQGSWDKQARALAVKELLPLKNDLWLGDNEREFTPQRFKDRMKLESIVIDRKGDIEFTFADGNLFWGHVIQVGGNIKKGLRYANIAG